MPQQVIDHHVSISAETILEDLYAGSPYLSATEPDFVVEIEPGEDLLAPFSMIPPEHAVDRLEGTSHLRTGLNPGEAIPCRTQRAVRLHYVHRSEQTEPVPITPGSDPEPYRNEPQPAPIERALPNSDLRRPVLHIPERQRVPSHRP